MRLLMPIILTAIVLTGCNEFVHSERNDLLESEVEENGLAELENDFEVILLDSCQYVLLKKQQGSNRGYGYMAHKGNCDNPIHLHECPLHCHIPASDQFNQVTEP